MKLPRFTLQTLFIAVTLIAAFFGWRLWELRDRQRMICDQTVAYTVSSLHWQAMDQKNYQLLDSSLSNSLNPNPAYRCVFLLPSGKFRDGTAADNYELQLLGDWSTASTREQFRPMKPPSAILSAATSTTTRRSARLTEVVLIAINCLLAALPYHPPRHFR